MPLHLTAEDQQLLDGGSGPGAQMAMRIVVRLAEALEAEQLLTISGANVDSCLYHGPSTLAFAERLLALGASVKVPTTLNVSSLDLLHPDLFTGDPKEAEQSRLLTECYKGLGGQPTWTCAPYQLNERPGFGQHVAWAESNAIVFANSVLGARTDRYGDFIDICAAITGRAPAAGLHLQENRRARRVFDVSGLPSALLDSDWLFPVLGALVGATTGVQVPVVTGVPGGQPEHRLKSLGAAAASSGGIGMFHMVGSTPEAPTLSEAVGGVDPLEVTQVSLADLNETRASLSTATGLSLGSVCLGTPHYSLDEFAVLVPLLSGRQVHPSVNFLVSTGRGIYHELQLRGWLGTLEAAGVTVVVDTCTYLSPALSGGTGPAMTDSTKWAYYAPSNLGVEVTLASTAECVNSAINGVVTVDESLWANG